MMFVCDFRYRVPSGCALSIDINLICHNYVFVTQISVECSNRNVETVVLGSSCCLLGHLQTLQVLGRALETCRILAYAFTLLLGACCGACSRRGDHDAFNAGLRLLHSRVLVFISMCSLSFRVTC